MADRYWVGGSGNWDDGLHWSTTSGGPAGASIPTINDDVYFDINSSTTSYTVLNDDSSVQYAKNLSFSAPLTGIIQLYCGADNSTFILSGNLILSSTMIIDIEYLFINNTAISATIDLTLNGVTLPLGRIEVPNGVVSLIGNSSITSTTISSTTIFNTNNYDLITNVVSLSGSPTLNLGSSVITTGYWEVTPTTTVNAATSTIKTSFISGFFNGGSKVYYNLWLTGTTGTFIINGSNTFNEIRADGTGAHTIKFTTGTTQTVNNFIRSVGTNIITIDSTTTGSHNLIKSGSGIISLDYLNIQHSIATPINTWYAGTNSINNQAVATVGSGWIFTNAPSANSNMFLMF